MEKITLNLNLITEMKSVNAERVHFPYNWEGMTETDREEFLWKVSRIVVKNGAELEEIADIAATLCPKTNKMCPLISLFITVKMVDGSELTGRMGVAAEAWEVANILTDYFTNGASGLKKEYAKCFDKQHRQYLRKCIMRGGEGLDPAFREIYQIAARMLQKGCSPAQVVETFDKLLA